ncbi:MAG: hypothetical protein JW778_04635 [Candidatus Altiarchaeota archaeon]|nr:hypothetical protein [Candidatus Altiarchaeota archaeon]
MREPVSRQVDELEEIQRAVTAPILKGEPDLKFGVGMSQDWDPYRAGVQAASKALEQIEYKPKFLLIFSTIHYADTKGGLKALLKGCRDLIKDDVPSIGGTITGFICPEGCYTRGCVVVAGGGDIDVTSAFGRNIFKDPISAGSRVGSKISKELNNSEKRTKLLLEFISGPIEPRIVMGKRVRSLFKKIPDFIAPMVSDILLIIGRKYLQYGASVEKYVDRGIVKSLKDFYLFGCSTFDDSKALRNYQFYDNEVFDRSVVTIGIGINDYVRLDKKISVIPTGKKMQIEKGWQGYSIKRINNKPAVSQYIKEMGWPEDYNSIVSVEDIGKKTWYSQLGHWKDNEIYPIIIGLFFGENIWVGTEITSDEIEVFLTSAKKIINDLKDALIEIRDKRPCFTFFAEVPNIVVIFGEKLYVIKELIDETLKDSPYLTIIGSGLEIKNRNENAKLFQNGFTMLSIFKSNVGGK